MRLLIFIALFVFGVSLLQRSSVNSKMMNEISCSSEAEDFGKEINEEDAFEDEVILNAYNAIFLNKSQLLYSNIEFQTITSCSEILLPPEA